MRSQANGRSGKDAFIKIGIEIGGTFTDLIAIDEAGGIRTHKVSTTPENPAIGSFLGLREMGVNLARVDPFLHGSTIATNAVLERKGAPTGLLTTAGFGDILTIQRTNKKDSYDPFYARPQALIPRHHVEEISERLRSDGAVLIPLNEQDVVRAATRLVEKEGIQTLAISFLHAYVDGVHERRAAEIVAKKFSDIYVTLSSDVLPRFREYERTSTTVISAYVKPIVDKYLQEFERHLREGGFAGAFLIMQASGGVLPSAGARSNPASMYLSGPAAGVVAAQQVSRLTGIPNLLTLDVGGTSTDLALVTDGSVSLTTDGEIGGLPMSLPIIDIISVGAGGGSLAFRDAGGMLRVGPDSAGAQPGPACYGRGGTRATVTDALLVLGLIPPDRFLGGRMKLSNDAAMTALGSLASEYGMSPLRMAESILRIAVANITHATRRVSIQRGRDPRLYSICAYGGAGPLLAGLVAQELDIKQVVVPPYPGLFSAFGLIVSDFKRDLTQTRMRSLGSVTDTELRDIVAGLRRQAEAEFTAYGVEGARTYQTYLDLRYSGQGFELPILIPDAQLDAPDSAAAIRRLFDEAHFVRYGHKFPQQEVVAVNFRVSTTAGRNAVVIRTAFDRKDRGSSPGQVFLDGTWHHSSLEFREGLRDMVRGPAVISEDTATTFVPSGWSARVDDLGNLILQVEEP